MTDRRRVKDRLLAEGLLPLKRRPFVPLRFRYGRHVLDTQLTEVFDRTIPDPHWRGARAPERNPRPLATQDPWLQALAQWVEWWCGGRGELPQELTEVDIELAFDQCRLTDRQKEVARHALEGTTVRQTADILGITASTVQYHLSRSLLKLQAVFLKVTLDEMAG